MTAWRDYYPPDLYPGFWECLQRYSRDGRVLSIDRVCSEIISPNELVTWANSDWGGSFAFSGEEEIVDIFAEMQRWVQDSDRFLPAAKYEFAGTADGWLAAYAKVHNAIVVTNEVFDPTVKRRIPLPNLCKKFSIPYDNTVGMLRGLGVRFDMRQPSTNT